MRNQLRKTRILFVLFWCIVCTNLVSSEVVLLCCKYVHVLTMFVLGVVKLYSELL